MTALTTATIVAVGRMTQSFEKSVKFFIAFKITYNPVYPFETEQAVGTPKYFFRFSSNVLLQLAFEEISFESMASITHEKFDEFTSGSLTEIKISLQKTGSG